MLGYLNFIVLFVIDEWLKILRWSPNHKEGENNVPEKGYSNEGSHWIPRLF